MSLITSGFTSRLRNLKDEAATYSRHSSKASHLRSTLSATAPVVFDPAKISSTKSPGSVRNRMKNSGSLAGNRAGCCFAPTSLQPLRYCPLDSVLGIWSRFEGIAPPLSWSARSTPRARSTGTSASGWSSQGSRPFSSTSGPWARPRTQAEESHLRCP